MESNGEHIYFWELILWGMAPKQANKPKHTNCTLGPNIDLTALKDTRQSPTLSHFHTLLSRISYATYPCTLCTNHTEVRVR